MGITKWLEREEPDMQIYRVPTNAQAADHLDRQSSENIGVLPGEDTSVSHADCPWCR
jgi:hypothetical protein